MNERFKYLKDYRDIEKDVLGEDINTREELQTLADEEGIKIDWQRWDALVQKVKKLIEAIPTSPPPQPQNGRVKRIWAYDIETGRLNGHFESSEECGQVLNVNVGTVRHSASTQKPVARLGMYFSYEPLTKDELRAYKPKIAVPKSIKKRHNPHTKRPKWVYRMKDNRLLGYYECTADCAEALDMSMNQVNYQAFTEKPYRLKGILILNHPIE